MNPAKIYLDFLAASLRPLLPSKAPISRRLGGSHETLLDMGAQTEAERAPRPAK